MAAAGFNFDDLRSSKEGWCWRENAHGCSIIYYSSMLCSIGIGMVGQGNGQAVAVWPLVRCMLLSHVDDVPFEFEKDLHQKI